MKKDKCPPCKKTSIGGQALMEGIMMRGPKKTAMAVRNPDGEIVLEVAANSTKTPTISKIPVLRGVYNFAMSMVQGYKCLMRSAEISGLEEAEEELRREKEAKKAEKAAKKAAKKGEESAAEQPAAEASATEMPATEIPVGAIHEAPTAEKNENSSKNDKKKDSTSLTTTLVMVLGVVLGLGLAILLFKFVRASWYILYSGERIFMFGIKISLYPLF